MEHKCEKTDLKTVEKCELNRDKQIEEMTEDLCNIECKGMKCNVCDHYGCEYRMLAEALYNIGYRKATDVAREIFEELKKVMIDEYRYPIIAELKKKYLEVTTNGDKED